jgi:hypothetical protein
MVFCANQGKKRRNPLWIASIFDADWRKSTPLQAMLPYGVSPKGGPKSVSACPDAMGVCNIAPKKGANGRSTGLFLFFLL